MSKIPDRQLTVDDIRRRHREIVRQRHKKAIEQLIRRVNLMEDACASTKGSTMNFK